MSVCIELRQLSSDVKLTIDTKRDSSIMNLKQTISELHPDHPQPQNQKLIFMGKLCMDHQTIGELLVYHTTESNPIFHLVLNRANMNNNNNANTTNTTNTTNTANQNQVPYNNNNYNQQNQFGNPGNQYGQYPYGQNPYGQNPQYPGQIPQQYGQNPQFGNPQFAQFYGNMNYYGNPGNNPYYHQNQQFYGQPQFFCSK